MVNEKKTQPKRNTKKTRSAISDVVAREYTIHMHKRIFGVAFKKRAPRAIKEIKAFALQQMGTSDVRLDPQLNKKKRNDEEGAKEKLYSYVQAVNVKNREAKGLQTIVVEDS
ncbi:60S ribosomal protein L31-B [Cyphellophora attinorum]|uniref:60S ribosomal protein L31-B n=1 Tax=Cyphellophora attinorum TaxID=1664694 RepID=A0A0N1HDX0_9EURO|nr:60S ribosomal protein L31-B [Phialophora attinorum]KPI42995.1 60S ribosomal protein L31-B [Phialophora attinorum]